ncbi:MAG: hypothetical protein V4558_06350 [Gemmatimonadota bacterium]
MAVVDAHGYFASIGCKPVQGKGFKGVIAVTRQNGKMAAFDCSSANRDSVSAAEERYAAALQAAQHGPNALMGYYSWVWLSYQECTTQTTPAVNTNNPYAGYVRVIYDGVDYGDYWVPAGPASTSADVRVCEFVDVYLGTWHPGTTNPNEEPPPPSGSGGTPADPNNPSGRYVTEIQVSPTGENYQLGSAAWFTATLKFNDGSTESRNAADFIWMSFNTSIAHTGDKGEFVFSGQGTTTIQAALVGGNGVVGTATVTVTLAPTDTLCKGWSADRRITTSAGKVDGILGSQMIQDSMRAMFTDSYGPLNSPKPQTSRVEIGAVVYRETAGGPLKFARLPSGPLTDNCGWDFPGIGYPGVVAIIHTHPNLDGQQVTCNRTARVDTAAALLNGGGSSNDWQAQAGSTFPWYTMDPEHVFRLDSSSSPTAPDYWNVGTLTCFSRP